MVLPAFILKKSEKTLIFLNFLLNGESNLVYFMVLSILDHFMVCIFLLHCMVCYNLHVFNVFPVSRELCRFASKRNAIFRILLQEDDSLRRLLLEWFIMGNL